MRKFLTSILEKIADKLREQETRSPITKNEEERDEVQPKVKKRPKKRKPIEKKIRRSFL